MERKDGQTRVAYLDIHIVKEFLLQQDLKGTVVCIILDRTFQAANQDTQPFRNMILSFLVYFSVLWLVLQVF
jgi:hypothetical protein